MLQNNNHVFQNPIEAIYDCAAYADSIQEIADNFYHLTNLPAVIADSLHYIVALTPDIRAAYGNECSWSDLVEKGVLTPIQDSADVPAPDPFTNALGSAVSPAVLMHKSTLDDGKTLCVMCDIRHKNNVLLKLAVISSKDFGDDSIHLVEALAKSLYTAWFRLRYTTNSIIDDKSRFLLSLLKGDNSIMPYGGLEGFPPEGPFIAASMIVKPDNLIAITFSSVCDELSRLLGGSTLSVFDSNEYIFLINVADNERITMLDSFAKHRRLTLGISQHFTDLSQAQKYHLQARGAAITASRFASFSGCAAFDDMKLFLMFDMFSKTEAGEGMIDPQVELLTKSDEDKNTGFMRTLFCWLLNSQRATAAAKQLGVHRNTLDNRLAKINELIDANWDSSSYATCMLYSLYITLDKLGQLEFFK